MRVLLHVCCAGCSLGALSALREEDMEVEGFFYNPNIHPLLEFRKRLKAVKVMLEAVPFPMTFDETYGLPEWIESIYQPRRRRRCGACYEARLRKTAEQAKAGGFDGFTTTLLISPHQYHDALRAVGERVGNEAGVPFVYRDFRPRHDEAEAEAKRLHLYRQQYCGCCMSEFERYRDTTREMYRPDIPAFRKAAEGGPVMGNRARDASDGATE